MFISHVSLSRCTSKHLTVSCCNAVPAFKLTAGQVLVLAGKVICINLATLVSIFHVFNQTAISLGCDCNFSGASSGLTSVAKIAVS